MEQYSKMKNLLTIWTFISVHLMVNNRCTFNLPTWANEK